MKKTARGKGAKAPKTKVADLSPRKTRNVKGGGRSDLAAKFQQQLTEANSTFQR